jgi:hypothetical protein
MTFVTILNYKKMVRQKAIGKEFSVASFYKNLHLAIN